MKFSIIVPVYNVVPYLSACLGSVLAQCEKDWECLCVDDGSTDGGEKILDEYAARDDRFIIVHKKNGGVSSARNAALDVARGEWLVYLDADDMLSPQALETLSKLDLKYPNADVLRYAIDSFSDCSQLKYEKEVTDSACTDRQKIIDGLNGPSFVTYIYRRELVKDLRFKPYSVGEDRLYLAEVLLRTKERIDSNYIGYYYRARPGSAMNSVNTLKKQLDSISWKRDVLALFDASTFEIGVAARRQMFLSLIEGNAYGVATLPEPEIHQGWKFWFSAVDHLPVRLAPSAWIGFVIRILKLTHSVCFAHLLCVFSYRLKVKGFHR